MGSASSKMRFSLRKNNTPQRKKQLTSRCNSFPGRSSDVNGKGDSPAKQQVKTDGNFYAAPVLTNAETSNGKLELKSNNINGNALDDIKAPNGDVSVKSVTPPPSARKMKVSQYANEMSPSELYNILVAETWQGQPQIHDMGYTLLLDCRDKASYEKLHIITARHHSALYSEYGLLLPSQLKLIHLVILYGNSDLFDNLQDISKKLAEDEVEHFVLQCDANDFFIKYPFLGTQNHFLTKDLRSTLQTMPSEIIPGLLYQGNAKHALDPYIISSLGITHIVNVTLEHPNKFEDTVEYMRIQLDDRPQVDLHSWLPRTSEFIRDAVEPRAKDAATGVVLVHCNLGRSRSSTVVLGYLMQVRRMSLGEASSHLKDCRPSVCPNVGFLEQLLKFEKEVLGIQKTELNGLPF